MSGLLGLIGSVGASLISNRGAQRRQKLADQQNTKFWNMQNAYNTPKAQMGRLTDAGLNPNLIYGSNANTGVAGSISASKPSPYNVQNPVPSMMQTALIGAQVENLKSITDKNNADTAIKLGMKDPMVRGAGAKADIAVQQALQSAVKTKEITAQQASTTKTLQQNALSAIANRKYAEALTEFRLGLIKLNIDPTGAIQTTLLKWISTSIQQAKEDIFNTNPGESWQDKVFNKIKG